MAIWAKNFKVRDIIIISVPVFMMNAKNSWLMIIVTSVAFIYQLTGKHCFSYGCKRRFKCFFRCFIYTRFRTILSIMTGMSYKIFKAMMTGILFFSFISLRHVVARTRAIFCFIRPARDMLKFIFAYFAIAFYLNSNKLCSTRTRAVFGGRN